MTSPGVDHYPGEMSPSQGVYDILYYNESF